MNETTKQEIIERGCTKNTGERKMLKGLLRVAGYFVILICLVSAGVGITDLRYWATIAALIFISVISDCMD